MAKLNFPNPNTTTTYTEAGITWTWNATLGVWSSDDNDGFTETDGDTRYLRKDATAGVQTVQTTSRTTFNGPLTTGHVTLPGGGGNNAAVQRKEVESMIQSLAPDVPGVGDITSVSAGAGLVGGGSMGAVSLSVGSGGGIVVEDDLVKVGAGTGITVNANEVALTNPIPDDVKYTTVGGIDRPINFKLDEYISVTDFGSINGTNDCSDFIKAAFQYAANLGANVHVPAGTYYIDKSITVNVAKGLGVECDDGVVFKVTSNYSDTVQVFNFNGGNAPDTKFSWNGGTIDGTDQGTSLGGAPDLMGVQGTNIHDVNISNCYFLNNRNTGAKGDSGLMLAGGDNYYISGCTFSGAPDASIYISGTSKDAEQGRNCIISNNHFLYSNVGVISKRRFQAHVVSNNQFYQNTYGVVLGGEVTDTSARLLPGQRCVVANNYFFETYNVAIELRDSPYSSISGNSIFRFGKDLKSGAIRVRGSSFTSVTGNSISNDNNANWVTTDKPVGIRLEGWNYPDPDKLAYQAITDHCSVVGNVIRGVSIGVEEQGNDKAKYNNIESNNILADTDFVISFPGTYSNIVDHETGNVDFNWGNGPAAMSIQRATNDRPNQVVFNYDIVDKNGNDITTLVSNLQARIATLESNGT